jgi:hypothetical protein
MLFCCGNIEPDTWRELGKPAVAAARTERAKAPGDAGMRASATDVSGLAANDPAAVAAAPRRPKLIGQLREALRSRHYSGRTEQAYCLWVKRFITFHHLRHPAEMAEAEINAFLTPSGDRGQGEHLDAKPSPLRPVVPLSPRPCP